MMGFEPTFALARRMSAAGPLHSDSLPRVGALGAGQGAGVFPNDPPLTGTRGGSSLCYGRRVQEGFQGALSREILRSERLRLAILTGIFAFATLAGFAFGPLITHLFEGRLHARVLAIGALSALAYAASTT
jgi:hypothetical protein